MIFRINKHKIFTIYNHYIFSDNELHNREECEGYCFTNSQIHKIKNELEWKSIFLDKLTIVENEISKRLKNTWTLERITPLEKAILVYSAIELLFFNNTNENNLIKQVISFSKSYLEKDKYKYINKILDLLKLENREKKI